MQTLGRYQLHEKLGQGGMGTVYRAYDTLLQRVVAVKVIARAIDENSELRERFLREARAAGQLSHKNIITIYDLGEHDGQPYLAMEYLEGEDLQRRLGGPEKMGLAHKLDLALELCEGLEYAHARGIVHRDIKPANIFITRPGTVKILDFGLARLITSELTNSNMMMGTLNYMAPEQVRGERADHRADIFSVGVVLYELLGGRKAFEGDSFASTMFKILQEVPQPLWTLDATLPPEIVATVERALAKPRDERYQSISEMIRDISVYRQQLSPMASGASGQRRPSDPPTRNPISVAETQAVMASPVKGESSARGSGTSADPMTSRPRIGALVAVTLAVIVLGGSAAFWMKMRSQAQTPPVSSATPPATAPPVITPPAAPPAAAASSAQQPPSDVSATAAAVRRAADAFAARDYAAAQRYAEEVLGRDPTQREAQRLRDRSREAAAGADRDARTRQPASRAAAANAAPARSGTVPLGAEPGAPPAGAARGATTATPTPGRPSSDDPPAALPPPVPQPQAPPSPVPQPQAAPSAAEAPKPPTMTVSNANPAKVTPPPPAAAAPEPTPRAEDAIADLLNKYRSTVESRDLDGLRRLWPSLGGTQLGAIRDEFRNARHIDMEIIGPHISVSGTTGVVSFTRRYQVETTDGQKPRSESHVTMDVRRAGPAWLIERIRFELIR